MTPTKIIIALVAAVSVAGFGAAAVAQKSMQKNASKRDQMMEKCLQEAGKVQGDLQQMTRTAIYKACMSKAGYKP
ncbi:MAG TPA: hypothetical protein VG986_19120 [Pseudolabrys sp.]|nr:hypothetical protein [Pseudolabrys sp.]